MKKWALDPNVQDKTKFEIVAWNPTFKIKEKLKKLSLEPCILNLKKVWGLEPSFLNNTY